MTTPKRLPIVRFGTAPGQKLYYADEQLREYRAVKNPHDCIKASELEDDMEDVIERKRVRFCPDCKEEIVNIVASYGYNETYVLKDGIAVECTDKTVGEFEGFYCECGAELWGEEFDGIEIPYEVPFTGEEGGDS